MNYSMHGEFMIQIAKVNVYVQKLGSKKGGKLHGGELWRFLTCSHDLR